MITPDSLTRIEPETFASAGIPTTLAEAFAALPDPRGGPALRYDLLALLLIALLTLICGGEGFTDMERFARAKQTWLRERLGLSLADGIPSHDTFGRLFARLDPPAFGACFLAWTQTLHERTQGQIIALDGKALRHSFDTVAGQAALHLVSAWAADNHLVLGQVAVDDKSNEITAMPALLALLDIRGCVVTTDAMGCQKAIAAQVREQEGDYVLALKGNQTSLHDDVRLFFEEARANDFFRKDPERWIPHGYHQTAEKDHGRIETRRCWVIKGPQMEWLDQKKDWAGLSCLAAVECERRVGAKVTVETRYFISSLPGNARRVLAAVRGHWGLAAVRGHWGLAAVRGHWGIENRLHWVLDVAMGEDMCRVRTGDAAQNLATLRHLTLNLLRREKTDRAGIKRRQLRAGWDNDFLLQVLTAGAQT